MERLPEDGTRFDFEIGELIKSPCKGCEFQNSIPECAEVCEVLHRIQTILSSGISCDLSPYPEEANSILLPVEF